ncbi:MAG: murein transglycosylase [Bacteroidota bacterium]|nr:murein transglycosylase [Bacteroidota bacterium]
MKNKITFFSLGFFAFFAILLFMNATTDSSVIYFPFVKANAKEENLSLPLQATYAVKIPASISFAGEDVPLDDPEVRERLDRELTVNAYWQSSTVLMLKRANRYMTTIERVLKEENVPDDFKFLAVVESNFDNVVSPAGATGFWQLMKAAATQYGLVVNDEVDERYNLEKATRAACAYLRDAKDRTGSWTAAAAAYNMGVGGVSRAQTRQGETAYYHLLLNSETSRYVQRMIAMKMIYQHPKDFGFYLNKEDLYPEFKFTVQQVSGAVDWIDFAKQNNINYKLLRIYNPWIRDFSMDNREKRTYDVKIPS